MNPNFPSLLLLWSMTGIFLVLLMRRHRMRLNAAFAW
jgi:hypothetical protein